MQTYEVLRDILQYEILGLIYLQYELLWVLKICRDCKNMRDIRYMIDIRDMLQE